MQDGDSNPRLYPVLTSSRRISTLLETSPVESGRGEKNCHLYVPNTVSKDSRGIPAHPNPNPSKEGKVTHMGTPRG